MTTPLMGRVTLKVATSLDGKIALANGQSQWITNSTSRRYVHQIRADHDAVMTGIGTVLADDPMLNVREIEGADQPVRVVIDPQARTPLDAKVLVSAESDCIIFTGPVDLDKIQALEDKGAVVIDCPLSTDGRIEMNVILSHLKKRGIHTVMIEAGGALAASALKAGVISHVEWFRAPIILGGDGLNVIADLGLVEIAEAAHFQRVQTQSAGGDLWESYIYQDQPCLQDS